jgi:hypothetical protein
VRQVPLWPDRRQDRLLLPLPPLRDAQDLDGDAHGVDARRVPEEAMKAMWERIQREILIPWPILLALLIVIGIIVYRIP